jgi:hypothetical protein
MQLDKIAIDENIYPRNNVSEFNVRRLVSAFKTGTVFPPLVVEAGTGRLVDGRHRLAAYEELEVKEADVIEKVYATEADLFADAVRLNVGHGQPLDQYCIRNAIIRLSEYGYAREQISDAVKLPVEQIERITHTFAVDETTGKPLALKGGLDHLRGRPLSPQQQAVNRHYSGPKATFYLRQLRELLERGMWPDQNLNFIREMDLLVESWLSLRPGEAKASGE